MRHALVAALLLALASSVPASACAVCYGDADSPLIDGMNNGILTLLVIIGVVQVGFAALFVNIWLRAKRLREKKERFHLIHGGVR